MALVKATIKAEVKTAFAQVMKDEGDRNEAIDRMADTIADAVMNAIKSVTVVYTSGLVAPPAGGAVTGTFTGKLT